MKPRLFLILGLALGLTAFGSAFAQMTTDTTDKLDAAVALLNAGKPKEARAVLATVSASGSYEMFMMFQPSGGCPVPLRAVTWSWSGAFTKSSGVWSGTSTNSIDPPDYPTTSFPTWNSSVKDYHWNPSL